MQTELKAWRLVLKQSHPASTMPTLLTVLRMLHFTYAAVGGGALIVVLR